MITQDELKRILEYNKDTGLFIWKKNPKNGVNIKNKVGTKKEGYIIIGLNGKNDWYK